MADLEYKDYQNLAEQMGLDAHSGTIAQYASMINDPAQLGQHLLSDAGAFMLHDKVVDGVKGLASALDFSEADVNAVLGEIGNGASAVKGVLGNLTENIKGAINDRFGDMAKKLRGHTSPENTAMNTSQDLTNDVNEAVARLPGGRTHGLLPFETERPEDEFSNPVNPDAARSVGAPNPQEEEQGVEQQEAGASEPEQSDLDRLSQEEAESLFEPPEPTGAQDQQNAPDPDQDGSAANDSNIRNAADQDGRRNAGRIIDGEEEEDLAGGEAALDLDPLTAVVGVGALIGSFFIHPHQEKEIAPAQMGTNYSVQIGA